MSRFRTAISSHEDVEPLFRSNKSEVLVLRLCTLPHTSRYSALELVRAADALVPLLQADGHTHTVADAESAPCRANAGLYCPKRLCVGVSGLHAAIDQFSPDRWKVLFFGAKHVDTLAASDLAVKIELLCHGAWIEVNG